MHYFDIDIDGLDEIVIAGFPFAVAGSFIAAFEDGELVAVMTDDQKFRLTPPLPNALNFAARDALWRAFRDAITREYATQIDTRYDDLTAAEAARERQADDAYYRSLVL